MKRVLPITLMSLSFCISLVASKHPNETEVMTKLIGNEIVFRVVNGVPAKLGEIPYQVSFKLRMRDGRYRNFCGGSVVDQTRILSAAHCFTWDGNACDSMCHKPEEEEILLWILTLKRRRIWVHEINKKRKHLGEKYNMRDVSRVYAVAGTLKTVALRYLRDDEGTDQWRKINKVLVPGDYWFPDNDLSLVFITQPFEYNGFVKPMPLASRDVDYGNMHCIVSGYGKINDKVFPDTLLLAHLELIPMRQCSGIHGRSMRYFICTSSYVTSVMEVHLTKKANKWTCKLCNEKQSMKRFYGLGTAKECRLHVQKLNGIRGKINGVNSESDTSDPDPVNSDPDPDNGCESEDHHQVNTSCLPFVAKKSKWLDYVDTQEIFVADKIEETTENIMHFNNAEVVLELPKKCQKKSFTIGTKPKTKCSQNKSSPSSTLSKLPVQQNENSTMIKCMDENNVTANSCITENAKNMSTEVPPMNNSKWAKFIKEPQNYNDEDDLNPYDDKTSHTKFIFQADDDLDAVLEV